MNRSLQVALAVTVGAVAFTAAGMREDQLTPLSVVSDAEAVETVDLRSCWPVEKPVRIDLAYSAVGWDLEPQPSGASVRLCQQDGVFVDGRFEPGAASRELATGLEGQGVFSWVPNVERKSYRVLHEVMRAGLADEDETLVAYFDFTGFQALTEAEMLAAVQGVSQSVSCTADILHPWQLVGGAGDGLQNFLDGATLTFVFAGAGSFSAEIVCEGGVVEVALDGRAVATVLADAQWTECAWSVGDYDVHTLTMTYRDTAGESGAYVGVRNVRWACTQGLGLAQDMRADVTVDLKEGVRVPRYFGQIQPFEYSSTNWIGDVVGVSATSVAKVTVVQLTGMAPDVQSWTEEVPGTLKVLVKKAGEDSVKWRPKTGVWKATFDILNGDDTIYQESATFDLRETKGSGLILMLR